MMNLDYTSVNLLNLSHQSLKGRVQNGSAFVLGMPRYCGTDSPSPPKLYTTTINMRKLRGIIC